MRALRCSGGWGLGLSGSISWALNAGRGGRQGRKKSVGFGCRRLWLRLRVDVEAMESSESFYSGFARPQSGAALLAEGFEGLTHSQGMGDPCA